MIKVKRIYEKPSPEDGARILVDRVWPRGMSKDRAQTDLWLKEIAPSAALRKWFAHDPARWEEFRRRYWKELDQQTGLVRELCERAEGQTITLLFSAKDTRHNNAVALREYLLAEGRHK